MNNRLRILSAIFMVTVLMIGCSAEAGGPLPVEATVSAREPISAPTLVPSLPPTKPPTLPPPAVLTESPTSTPAKPLTELPTKSPTQSPLDPPTAIPINPPTPLPINTPTAIPAKVPTALPLEPPTAIPAKVPDPLPTEAPTPPPTVPAPTQAATATPEATGSAGQDSGLAAGQVSLDLTDEFNRCAMGRALDCTMEPAIERGLFETGLKPIFPSNVVCSDIDEGWAIVYTSKRNRESYHGGIDMPAPAGTPMISAAAGTVIGVYPGKATPRGIEIVLRHSPEDTGLPVWTYIQYTHFSEMPDFEIGQRVSMGEILGPTGNTGISIRTGEQSTTRRPAIHFGVFFNTSGQYAVGRGKIIPLDGMWMDPNALFRGEAPFDSKSLKALPLEEKEIPVAVMFEDGTTYPADAKIVWPYTCEVR